MTDYEKGRADFKQELIEAMPESFYEAEGDNYTAGINEGLAKAFVVIESVPIFKEQKCKS